MASNNNILINVLANTQQLTSGMRRAENTVTKSAKIMKTAMLSFAGVFIAGTLKNSILDTFSELDKIGKTADKLGIATDALIGLQHGAEQSGISIQALNTSLQRSTRRISEASAGYGSAQSALKELGLNAKALNDLSPDEQLNAIADAMLNTTSKADKLRLSIALFDTEGANMVNLLANGSRGLQAFNDDADELGLTMDRGVIKSVEDANDGMDRLTKAFTASGTALKVQLAPYITVLSNNLTRLLISMSKSASGAGLLKDSMLGLAKFVLTISSALQTSYGGFNAIYALIKKSQAQNKFNIEGTAQAQKALTDATNNYNEALKANTQNQIDFGNVMRGTDETTKNLIKEFNTLIAKYDGIRDAGNKLALNAGKPFKDITIQAEETNTLLKSVENTAGSGLTSAFRNSLDGAVSWGDTFQSIIKDVLAQLIKVLVIQKAIGAISGAYSNLTESASGVATQSATSSLASTATNQRGLNVNVVNNVGASVGISERGGDLNVIIDAVNDNIANGIQRNTSPISQALETSYGLSR